ncbi:MAG: TIGR02710 family CRISPR-associated CARF protein [Nanoarchaeota archaeon]|nr:TIGR02710 family CRISPR-associated CARF protein [Nanoarchaeota archaeon]
MKALIISIGGTPEPVIYSIDSHSPDMVLLFCSDKTVEDIQSIKQKIKAKVQHYEKVITRDHEDIIACIEAAKKCVELISKNAKPTDEVFVDITGGTKAMAAGMLLGTYGNNYTYSYVGGQKRDEAGRVISTSMQIKKAEDPALVFKDSEKKAITSLFNLYRFEAVSDTISKLQKSQKDEDLFNGIKAVSEGYALWEKFLHKEAYSKLKEGVKAIEIYNKYAHNAGLGSMISDIKENLEFLSRMGFNPKILSPTQYHITDLYSNALRRIEESKYDDAVARLYSCMELIGKFLLHKQGIDDSDVEEKKLPQDVREKFAIKYRDVRGKIKLPLKAKFLLLERLGIEQGKLFKARIETDFNPLMATRNNSILAHGIMPIGEGHCERFSLLVAEFVLEERVIFPKLKAF